MSTTAEPPCVCNNSNIVVTSTMGGAINGSLKFLFHNCQSGLNLGCAHPPLILITEAGPN
jgi:hypothetical protein